MSDDTVKSGFTATINGDGSVHNVKWSKDADGNTHRVSADHKGGQVTNEHYVVSQGGSSLVYNYQTGQWSEKHGGGNQSTFNPY